MNQKKPNKVICEVPTAEKMLSNLLERSRVLESSIDWWDNNISDIISEIDRLEALTWSPEIQAKISDEQDKLKRFLRRGDTEKKAIDELEKDIQNFFSKWGTN
tara:strand:- start:7001 stop:7309 length:309 start_codon:yes stop_codon:yes gene_type:complete